jgi:MSHA biogenesis protein MshL
MRMRRTWLTWFAVSLALFGCTHQSVVTPSTGHIDGDTVPQKPAPAGEIPKPVRGTAYLPPPAPRPREQTYSVVVNEVPVKEILFALARESNLNIDIHPAIQGKVTLNAVDQTLPAILERLAKQVDLTYKIENNVLTIAPDYPVLRTYKIDYVNMSRDTKGFIGAAAEISSTGQNVTTGTGGTSVTTSSSGGANNSSRTSVTSESQNRFWENLEKNIEAILSETDKEVVIRRLEGDWQSSGAASQGTDNGEDANTNTANVQNSVQADSQKALTEFRTLFAANVISNREAGVITVRATSKQHEKVQEFIDKVMSSARRQVLIEATIVEVQLNDGYQAGIDWSRLGNAGASSGFTLSQRLQLPEGFARGGLQTRATGTGLIAGYFNPTSSFGDIAASIRLLEEFGETKVLSSPKLMVLNNQTAVLKVVDNLVYFTIQAQQSTIGGTIGGTLATVTTTPNTVPVGIVMSVTPQINEAGNVNISVRPTISSLIRYVPDPNPQLKLANVEQQGIPEIQVREMESVLQVSSGSTAVLGGLMQDLIKNNTDKVPGLSSIPGLGRLFTGKNNVSRKTELVIFLRPTVITNASLESDELQGYKQYLPSQQLQQSLDESAY